jgi:hypothetical protein
VNDDTKCHHEVAAEEMAAYIYSNKEIPALSKKVYYKKDYKQLYMPKTVPEIVVVPRMPFFKVSGSGDPNGEEFAKVTEALYSMSYAVRMSYKSEDVPVGYYEYTVFPLEGVWDLLDRSKPATDKNNLKYTIMIRQPDFLKKVRFEHVEDGLSCQMMHIGSFDDEPESFVRMEAFYTEHGFIRSSKIHREIYLSDPLKTEPSKLKTVLRFPVNKP